MTLDVVVTNRAGKPVSGLQQRDFTLLDNQRPRSILSFQAVEGGTATPDPPVELILIVDAVNTPFMSVADARNGIEKFLRRNGGALARPVSLVYLTDSGVTETPFSRDGNALIADLKREQTGLRATRRSQGEYGGYQRLQLSLKTLSQLAGHVAATPGRKLVVWVSLGWPYFNRPGVDSSLSPQGKQGIFNRIVNTSDALWRARITLSAADPSGPMDTSLVGTTDSMQYMQFSDGVRSAGQAQYGNLALQVLAYRSGGLVLQSGNDVAGEIAECQADASAYYILSFDRAAGDGPDEYHALDIKLGKPGLAARTRSGYYAQPGPEGR